MACAKCETGTTGPGHTCTLPQRLMAKVRQHPDGCWEWTGATNGRYGELRLSRSRKVYAHRLMYELLRGPVPAGHVVMHACDRPLCVNPLHLTTGTQAENLADMRRKGRGHWQKTAA